MRGREGRKEGEKEGGKEGGTKHVGNVNQLFHACKLF